MKTKLIPALLMLLPWYAYAQDATFGDWHVIQASNKTDYIAVTGQDNFDKALGYRCFSQSKQCVHFLIADIACEDGSQYPVLVNSDYSALSFDTICSENEGSYELILSNFDAIHEILIKSNVAGFAIPMASGQFKVVRFSLSGSSEAMSEAERRVQDSAEYM